MANKDDVVAFIDSLGNKIEMKCGDDWFWVCSRLSTEDVTRSLCASNETMSELRDFLTAKLEGNDGGD